VKKGDFCCSMMLEVGNHPCFMGTDAIYLIHLLHNTDYLKKYIYVLTAEVVNILVMQGERQEKKS
jgi:hypothetical protein